MVRVQPLAAVAALLLGSAGCQTADKAQTTFTSMKQTVGLAPPDPVSEVLTVWDPRLGTLSDPTRDGAMVAGLVGQVFMLTPRHDHAVAAGDLGVVVYDTTPRPQGQPERTPELYHLTQETLAKLRTRDERFGLFYAMFLPWPAEWTDVTSVKVLARYQAPGGTAIQAREVAVRLMAERAEFKWEKQSVQRVGESVPEGAAPRARRGVPDPLKMLASLQGSKPAPPPANAAPRLPPPSEKFTRSNVPSADGGLPPAMTAVNQMEVTKPLPPGSNTTYFSGDAYAGPKPVANPLFTAASAAASANGPVQPILIRRE